MESALSALDQTSREVIVLYYYEEMSVKEVAKTLGIFEGTVKSRLYFARRKLKRIVQEGGGHEK
jgi:RNA polymerase sigma-70 factor (ECF subfamily)